MNAHLTVLCLLQQLAVDPYPARLEQPVTVRASAADGTPIAGLEVQLAGPDGVERSAGTTDAAGRLTVVIEAAGHHRLAATHEGVRLVAPLVVLADRPRWLYALVCVPLGLVILYRLWRRPTVASPAP